MPVPSNCGIRRELGGDSAKNEVRIGQTVTAISSRANEMFDDAPEFSRIAFDFDQGSSKRRRLLALC